jgi:hypothetical protein
MMIHCVDPKGWCGGQPIGGYAWTEFVWWWNNYHVAYCPIFYHEDSTRTKALWLEDEKEASDADFQKYARDAAWLITRAIYFIHEMMHLWFVDQDSPHITDRRVDNHPSRGRGEKPAYGPLQVYRLAHNSGPGKYGGAKWSVSNADTYVQAVNSVYWYKRNGIYPLVSACWMLSRNRQLADKRYLGSRDFYVRDEREHV